MTGGPRLDPTPVALAREMLAYVDAGDLAGLSDVMHDDVVLTFIGITVSGIGQTRELLQSLCDSIPDQVHEIEDAVEDRANGSVALQLRITGTHTGAPFPTTFGRIATTGRSLEWRAGSFVHTHDGKVSSWTVYVDQLAVLGAFGVAVAPGREQAFVA